MPSTISTSLGELPSSPPPPRLSKNFPISSKKDIFIVDECAERDKVTCFDRGDTVNAFVTDKRRKVIMTLTAEEEGIILDVS